MARLAGMPPHVAGERLPGPGLRGVAEVGGPGAGDVDDPGPVPVADAAGPAPPGRVGERRPQAAVAVLADARLGGVGVDAEPRGHGCRGLAAGLRQQHARPVDAPRHLRPRPRDPLELLAVPLGELEACGCRGHGMPLPLSPALSPLSRRKGHETHYL